MGRWRSRTCPRTRATTPLRRSSSAPAASVEELLDPLDRTGQHGPLAPHDHRALEELGVFGHQVDRLPVLDLALAQAELLEDGLARAEKVAGGHAGLADDLHELLP